jgi:hypothetical protein
LAGTVFQGSAANPARHRERNRAIVNRQLFGAALIVLLVAALVGLPKVASSSLSTAGTGITYLKGQTPMNAPYGAGTTVGGVTCGPRVLQVPWSNYAPPCEPAWHGNNGGATAPGVTATTINVSFRAASTAILNTLYLIIPKNVIGTSNEAIQTMQALFNTFNKRFELYGRHVVLEPYVGKGNFITEDTGGGATQAEADAVNVADSLHAFADISLVGSSDPYTEDLEANHVVAFQLYVHTQQYYQQNSPWLYSPGPNCNKSADSIAALFGRQLKGVGAQFAGGSMKGKPVKIGIVYMNSAQGSACDQALVQALQQYNLTPAKQASYTFDISKLGDEASSAISEMQQAGVNTIICSSCDPVTPIDFFQAANADHYQPEWFLQSLYAAGATTTDKFMRLYPANQTKHLIMTGAYPPPLADAEANTAFNLGNTDPAAKLFPSYNLVYATVLQFFDALQLAGPNLTPANFEQAMKSIPESIPGGELGGWNGTYGPYDPSSTFQVMKWDPTGTSISDGQKGTFELCNGGSEYPYVSDITSMPLGKPLTCSVPSPSFFHPPGQQGLLHSSTAPPLAKPSVSPVKPSAPGKQVR